MSGNRHTPRPQVCSSRRFDETCLRLIREPWGHYSISRADAGGQCVVGEADTFTLARGLYRQLCEAEAARLRG